MKHIRASNPAASAQLEKKQRAELEGFKFI
jgi:hypothetical protein